MDKAKLGKLLGKLKALKDDAHAAGAGKAGKHAAAYLKEQGHRVLNADITRVVQPGLDYLHVDVTDPAQVFSSMSDKTKLVISLNSSGKISYAISYQTL